MGMYDTIYGEQVKCFTRDLKNYNLGDRVPYKTDLYNYTPNFNIIIVNSIYPFGENDVLISIRNGKVKNVKNLDKSTSEDWKNMEKCISYYGEILRIKSKDEALDYISKVFIYNKGIESYIRNEMPYRKAQATLLKAIASASEEEKENFTREYCENIKKERKESQNFIYFQNDLKKKTFGRYIEY